MIRKAVQPDFAEASAGRAKARASEAPGLSREAGSVLLYVRRIRN